MLADAFFSVTWGRLRLYCSAIATDNSRTVVVHELAEGDDHPSQDHGLRARRVRCSLLFDEIATDTDTPLKRLLDLKAAVDGATVALFTHPIEGQFLARVGEFTYEIDDDSNIHNANIEFIKDVGDDAVSPTGAGRAAQTGEGAVAAAAADLATAALLADLEPSDITTAAIAAQDSWFAGDEPVSTRQIIVDVANVSNLLSSFIEDNNLEDDLELFDVYRATILLGDAMRSAALSATAEVSAVFVLHIARPIALLALCAGLYGGAEAEDRQRQAEALNDIRRPGWLDPGDYVMPSRSLSAKAAL